MSSGNPTIQVELAASVGAFKQQLADAAKSMEMMSKAMGGSLGDIDTVAKKSGETQKTLLDKFKDFRSEQVQQGRQARFLASELAGIIPAADGAKAGVQAFAGVLIEGAAGGLSFGLALEAVKLGVMLVTDYFEDAAKRSEAVLKANRQRADDTAASVTGLGRAIDAINGQPLTETEKAIRENTDEANKKLREQDRLLQDMRDRGEDLDRIRGGDRGSGMEVQSEKYKRALEDREAIRRDGLERERQLRERGSGEERAINEKQLKAEEVAKLQHEASMSSGVAAIRKRLAATLKEIDNDPDLQPGARETKRVHAEQQADEEIARFRLQKAQELALSLARMDLEMGKASRSAVEQLAEEGAVALLENEQRIADARRRNDAVELDNLLRIRNELANIYAERIRIAGIRQTFSRPDLMTQPVESSIDGNAVQWTAEGDESAGQDLSRNTGQLVKDDDFRRAQERMRQWEAPLKQAGNTLADGIVDGFDDGFKNFGQVLTGVGKMFLKELLNLGIQAGVNSLVSHLVMKPAKIAEATAQAGLVGAGTAASLASNPLTVLGAVPAGIAAMEAAMAAFVPVASASRGWDLPAGGPFPLLGHSREMMLPEKYADVVRGLPELIAGRGGRAGVTNVFNVYATDAGSFIRANRRLIMAEIARAGRAGES